MQKPTSVMAVVFIAATLTACGGSSGSIGSSGSSSSSSSSSSTSSSSSSGAPGAGDLLVNEVVAKSGDAGFLAGNDWIELYNAGTVAANLSDYALADGASGQIRLPALELAPGEYWIIAAVDADDANPPSASVPFKLGGTDSVSLYRQGNLLSRLTWSEGEAPEGKSFGLLDGVAQTLQPTPAAANQKPATTPAEIVRGNPTGNSPLRISEVVPQADRPTFYESSDWIELVNTGDRPINLGDFQLTDSNNPLDALPQRTIQPGEYMVILAGGDAPTDGTPHVTFGLGREDSVSLFRSNEEVDYISWGNDESKNGRSYGRQENNLQILYPTPAYANVPYELFVRDKVFTVRVDVAERDWQAMLANPRAEEYFPADFELNGAKIANVGFRIKGQGSLMFVQNSIRYGFKVDMNRYVDQKFMGMKMLVLNQSFSDPTFMRDVLSYDLMRDAGMPAPEISYVDLWVADHHLGLYQLVEMIDSEFVEKHFPDDADEVGDLYKGEIGQRLTWSGANISTYRAGLPLQTNEETIGTVEEGVALVNFLDGINNGSSPLSHINTDLTVKYLAAAVLTGNMDSPLGATANNFYLYEQRSQNIFTLLPWDYNLAFGMWGNGPARSIGGGFGGGAAASSDCRIVNHVIDNPVHDTNSVRPMLDAVLADPQLRQAYHAELQRLLNTVYNTTYMQNKIEKLATLIDAFVQADPTKYFTYEEWRMSLTQDLPGNSNIAGGRGAGVYGPAPGLLHFIEEKSAAVQRQLNGTLPSSNGGGTACPPGM